MTDDGAESGCIFFDREDDCPTEDSLFDVKVVSVPMLYDVLQYMLENETRLVEFKISDDLWLSLELYNGSDPAPRSGSATAGGSRPEDPSQA